MVRRLFMALGVMVALCVSAMAQPGGRGMQLPDYVVFTKSSGFVYGTSSRTEGRSNNFSPTFFIYPDGKLDKAGAEALVNEFVMDDVLSFTLGNVVVLNPVGEKYSASADFDAFVEMFNRFRPGNLKVIGLGQGATFVNNVIAPKSAGYIAGILTVGGDRAKLAKGASFDGVPAYVAGKNAAKVAPAYETINAAHKDEHLLKVVTNVDANASLSAVFADAWKKVLGTCYRFNNYKHTHYEGCKYGEYGIYELEPYTDWETLDITRETVKLDQRGGKPWLWYEYWPNELREGAAAKSVPIMVLLHGNTNDPRTQAETSGFLEVQGEERFFMVEMEWQGSNDFGAMGHDGVEQVLNMLVAKYPQLDPSRIYCEGLSAGSMTSTALGIKKSHVFAAVGGHSGGIFGGMGNASFMTSSNVLWAEATQKRGAVEMPYCSVGGTADKVVPYPMPDNYKGNNYVNAWNTYEQMNGVAVVSELDFTIDPVFGQKLANRQSIKTNKGAGIVIETGEILKGEMPVIKMVAVMDYGHWNFQPTARIMWDFFKHYSRDQKTYKLIYTK